MSLTILEVLFSFFRLNKREEPVKKNKILDENEIYKLNSTEKGTNFMLDDDGSTANENVLSESKIYPFSRF